MANYVVTNESELKDAIGYWDESGSAHVEGTALAGDWVIIEAGTITLTVDRILYTESCPNILGRGSATTIIEGQIVVSGVGGTRHEAEWIGVKFDSDGGSVISQSGTPWPTFSASSLNLIANQTLYLEGCVFTNNDSATSGTSANIFTVVSDRDLPPIRVVAYNCEGHLAGADVISTKGAASNNANPASRLFLIGGYYHTPGSDSTDQTVTAHDLFPIICYGCRLEASTSTSNWVAVAGTISDRMELRRCTIKGRLARIAVIEECDIDLQIGALSSNQYGILAAGSCLIRRNRLSGLHASGTDRYGIFLQSNAAALYQIHSNFFDGASTSGTTAVFYDTTSLTYNFEGAVDLNGNVLWKMARGFDIRTNSTTTAPTTIRNNFCNLGAYHVLRLPSGVTPVTRLNVFNNSAADGGASNFTEDTSDSETFGAAASNADMRARVIDLGLNFQPVGMDEMVARLRRSSQDAIEIDSKMATTHINATAGKVDGVALVDVTTTNTDMRGTDGANTVAPDNSTISTLASRLTNERAGYLDKLNVTGDLAHTDNAGTFQADVSGLATQADVAAITQAQRVRLVMPSLIERPDSSTTTYRLYIYAYDAAHLAEDLDSNPVVVAENGSGTDRSSNLGTVTKPTGTGIYYVDYTLSSGDAIEQLFFRVTATEGGNSTEYSTSTQVVDTTAVDFTAEDRAKLEAIFGMLPSRDYLAGTDQSTGAIAAADKSGYSLTPTTGLGNQTANITGNLSGSVGSVIAVDFTSADRTKLEAIHTKLPSRSYLAGTDQSTGAITSADKSGYSLTSITGLGNQTANITGNLSGSVGSVGNGVTLADGAITTDKVTDGAFTAAKFASGAFAVITDLLTAFVRLLARKDEAVATDHAAELAIINANTGTGAGAYNNTGQAQEALATSLTAANEVLSNLSTTTVTVISHQQPGGGITLVQGDTYKASNNRPLQWINPSGNGWPTDLNDASIKFTAIHVDYVGTAIGDIPSTHKIQADGSVVQATTPDQEIIVELESTVTDVAVGLYEYDVEVTIDDDVTTLVTTAQPEQKPPSFAMPDVSTFKLEVLPQFTPAP